MIRFVKEINENIIVFVDNCYGEFVEEREPCHVGADLMAGSLIKTRRRPRQNRRLYHRQGKMGESLLLQNDFTGNWQ